MNTLIYYKNIFIYNCKLREIMVNTDKYENASKILTDYISKNNISLTLNKKIEEAYNKFQSKYSPEVLKKLEGNELLNYLFLHDGNKENLAYALEFDNDYKYFGSTGVGTSYKYRLFKDKKTNHWVTGISKKNEEVLSLSGAIEKAIKIRDSLVNGGELIKNSSLNTPEDYENLEKELTTIFKGCDLKPTFTWIHKYYHMIYPNKFPVIHSDNWRKYILNKFSIDSSSKSYYADGEIVKIAKLAKLDNYTFYKIFISKFGKLDHNNDSENLNNTQKIWILSPGEGAKLWDEFKQKNIITIGWGDLGDLNQYESKDEIRKELQKNILQIKNKLII